MAGHLLQLSWILLIYQRQQLLLTFLETVLFLGELVEPVVDLLYNLSLQLAGIALLLARGWCPEPRRRPLWC
jgi:hypothetical protein